MIPENIPGRALEGAIARVKSELTQAAMAREADPTERELNVRQFHMLDDLLVQVINEVTNGD